MSATVCTVRAASPRLTEALLVHRKSVGYVGSPSAFLGHDEQGRQVLTLSVETCIPIIGRTADDERATFHLSIAATFDDVAYFFLEPVGLPAPGGRIEARDQAVSEFRWQADR